jgi:hypothetical protein
MLFDTFQYWVFFALTLALLAALPHRAGKVALVALSYVFYGFWDVRFLLLLAGSTLANYVFGLLIEAREVGSRRLALAIAVTFNVTLLGIFKYFNFFVASFAALFGLPETNLALNVLLPVGISFFTFEGIAYVTDVYRRDLHAVRGPVDFALFVSFFPHLVAGPIIRPANFFPQTEMPPIFAAMDVNWGLVQILKGLIKKIVFADFFGPIADACFTGRPYQGMTVAPLFGLLAFSFQIYFDFAGYTDIARGCAALLGYKFPPNFERPYLAHQYRRVLEALAHFAFELAEGLSLYPARRQPPRRRAHLSQHDYRHGPRWPMAWGQLELPNLGSLSRSSVGDAPPMAERSATERSCGPCRPSGADTAVDRLNFRPRDHWLDTVPSSKSLDNSRGAWRTIDRARSHLPYESAGIFHFDSDLAARLSFRSRSSPTR